MSATNITLGGLPTYALDNTMGAALVGIIISGTLWGVLLVQVYYYFSNFLEDSIWTKLMVATLFLLNTAHQGFVSHFVYTYIVTWYGQASHLSVVLASFIAEVPLTAVIIFVSQTFMILRISRLSRMNRLVVGFLLAQSIAAFVILNVFAGQVANSSTLDQVSTHTTTARIHNAICASCDISISFAIIWYLQTSKTGFTQSTSVISRLIIFTVNSGLITSVCAVCALFTNIVWPNTLIFLVFFLNIGRLHTSVTFATLNIRKEIQGNRRIRSVVSGASFLPVPGGKRKGPLMTPTVVSITTETETTVDSGVMMLEKSDQPSFGSLDS